MLPVDRLNKYPPFTVGFVYVRETRYSASWVPGLILGRVDGQRRVLLSSWESVFIEHEQQFQLVRPSSRPCGYRLFQI